MRRECCSNARQKPGHVCWAGYSSWSISVSQAPLVKASHAMIHHDQLSFCCPALSACTPASGQRHTHHDCFTRRPAPQEACLQNADASPMQPQADGPEHHAPLRISSHSIKAQPHDASPICQLLAAWPALAQVPRHHRQQAVILSLLCTSQVLSHT